MLCTPPSNRNPAKSISSWLHHEFCKEGHRDKEHKVTCLSPTFLSPDFKQVRDGLISIEFLKDPTVDIDKSIMNMSTLPGNFKM